MDLTQEEENTVKKALEILKNEAEIIAGSWNGDEAGRQEEMAHTALEFLASLKETTELLAELNEM